MQIRSYNPAEYAAVFHQPYHIFNTVAFNELNAAAQNVHAEFLAFKTQKHKLGIIGAVDEDNVFRSPFSAPFGGFSYMQKEIGLQAIDECLDLLKQYLQRKKSGWCGHYITTTFL